MGWDQSDVSLIWCDHHLSAATTFFPLAFSLNQRRRKRHILAASCPWPQENSCTGTQYSLYCNPLLAVVRLRFFALRTPSDFASRFEFKNLRRHSIGSRRVN